MSDVILAQRATVDLAIDAAIRHLLDMRAGRALPLLYRYSAKDNPQTIEEVRAEMIAQQEAIIEGLKRIREVAQ